MNETEKVLRLLGARPPIRMVGHGSAGRVYCDSRGHAYKVPSGSLPALWLTDEAEWLRSALKSQGLKPFLPRLYKFHRNFAIIERECIFGDVADDSDISHLRPLFSLITSESFKFGWSGPEYSANAFVFVDGDRERPILVDHGLAHRIGTSLVKHVEGRLKEDLGQEELEYLLEQVNDSTHNHTISESLGGHLKCRIEDRLVEVPQVIFSADDWRTIQQEGEGPVNRSGKDK